MKKKRIIKQVETNFVDTTTGEIVTNEILKEWIIPREELDYVKLYFNAVLEFNAISSKNTPLLIELIKYMTYADDIDRGGQIIYLNKYLKDKICQKLKIKDITFRTNLKKLCDGKILRRIATSTYQANPLIFGKGDWQSIKNLRADFDWTNGFIVLETKYEKNSEELEETNNLILM